MVNPILSALPTTIFEEMSGLARAHDAINLGQGFPDEPGPRAIRAHAADQALNGDNQYAPMRGTEALRQAVAQFYARQELDLDWRSEVTITSGATEALAAAFLTLIQPGDEVILFQPLYDAYAPMVKLAGGIARLVRLEPPHWTFTREMLEAAFNAKTRLIVVNSPMNPTGVVLNDTELALLAEFCVTFDAIAVCDEVWEAVVFDHAVHRPLMAFPGMRERTVKIGSAGKLFALTGWKIGWLIAAPALTASLARAHQFLTFSTAPNLQSAVAYGLANSEAWFAAMPLALARSRDRLQETLRRYGFTVLDTAGTYFLTVDIAASGVDLGDRDLCLRAVKDHGVAAIPLSAFYEADPVTSIIRLCFAKKDEILDEGARRLAKAAGLSAL
jgi:N-succinyldiaminopimelate aminotransferase